MRGPRSGRARDGDGPVGEMSDSCQNAGQHAGQQPPSRSGGWPHQCITPSNQRSDPVAGVWVPVAVEEEEAVRSSSRSSRMTAWRQVGQHLHTGIFSAVRGKLQNFDHRDMNNHAEIGNSVTHLAAPRKTYAPPRRPGTGKTYSETGRHAWGERTRPPKFIGKNRT